MVNVQGQLHTRTHRTITGQTGIVSTLSRVLLTQSSGTDSLSWTLKKHPTAIMIHWRFSMVKAINHPMYTVGTRFHNRYIIWQAIKWSYNLCPINRQPDVDSNLFGKLFQPHQLKVSAPKVKKFFIKSNFLYLCFNF